MPINDCDNCCKCEVNQATSSMEDNQDANRCIETILHNVQEQCLTNFQNDGRIAK